MNGFYLYFFIRQDLQDEQDFLRFPDETVKTTSACRRYLNFPMPKILDASAHRLKRGNINIDNDNTYSAERIGYFRLLPGTGNLKYPDNPVNPVKNFFK